MVFGAADLIMIEVNNGTSATYELLIVFIGKSVASNAFTYCGYQIQSSCVFKEFFYLLYITDFHRYVYICRPVYLGSITRGHKQVDIFLSLFYQIHCSNT